MRPKIHPARTVAKRAGLVVAGLIALLIVYGTAGIIGGSIPSNTGWTQAATGVRIYVQSNGIHTGIVVPVVAQGVDWRDLARAEDLRDPRYAAYSHVSFGWGDRGFYVETPTWADVKPLTVLAAAAGSERTVLHVDHLPEPRVDADTRAITLRPEEYRRLADFIRATIRSETGQRPAHQYGYAGYDAFYEAQGHYSAIRTCNAWTGEALRHAGVRIGVWTPFPVTVLGWFAQ